MSMAIFHCYVSSPEGRIVSISPWAFSSRLCSKMKRWLQLGYQIMGWEQHGNSPDCVTAGDSGDWPFCFGSKQSWGAKISDFEIL